MSNFLTRALIENDTGYVIERSLRFSSASSQSLDRTFGTPTDNNVWTWSGWVKRGDLTASIQVLFGAHISSDNSGILYYSGNTLTFSTVGGTSINTATTSIFRDTSAWYHVVLVFNTDEVVAADRLKIYVNNVRQTLSYTAGPYGLGAVSPVNTAGVTHSIGRLAISPFYYFDGYQAEDIFVDGQALLPSSFAETNLTTGQWVAKKYTGTYGTNGFYLDFKDGTSTTTLGDDKSGNNNDWTLTNFTRSAGVNDCWMLDVPAGNGSASAVQPSGNYAVITPLQPASASISEGNLKFLNSSGGANQTGITIELPTGFSFYFEVVPSSLPAADDFSYIGNSSCYYCSSGKIFVNGSVATTVVGFVNGDVVAIAGTVGGAAKVYKNNILMYDATTAICSPSTVINTYSGGTWQMNFGQRSFAYTPPTGFKALCTANLPVPTIKKPSDHFNVQLSTGANIKTDSEALFTNELVWIKDRANANNHQLIDAVRGTNAVIQTNTQVAETTYTAPSGSSVGLVWRASDSAAVTNNVGSISSQVSANVAAGFSIVLWTAGASAGTVGHGLGIAPKVILYRSRTGAPTWLFYHQSVGIQKYLEINSTNGPASNSTVFSSQPTSTVFDPGTGTTSGNNYQSCIAYCFAEIEGFSKFGSYTGNGSADGTNVTLGFEAAFVMIKRTDTTGDWIIFDSTRSADNPTNEFLYANLAFAEASSGADLDINSNGFKLRNAGGFNTSGGTYIYMAFAETPINYANAR